ncbi:ABC transporter permease [Solitalea koreensis]|uniref:ABC-2 type transport system permease protein n=1 Tax=Solitalea koreensis TaxID=543615 RepID=A0A521DP53_9SPHI|nr:ABC transporter permease [Solitalea koreensis]SMO73355.1 ABC-2 type transport system permease protein [Solitalea koreensis]
MRTIKFLLQKEFRQIFRNKTLLRSILISPCIQLLILPLAANYEVKNISLAVVDNDHSAYSQKMISKITSSGYFKLTSYNSSFKEAYHQIEEDKADIILEIPAHFERNLVRENEQKLFVAVNAINGTKALLGGGYLANIINNYNNEIRLQWVQPSRFNTAPLIEIASSNWYNPLMNYQIFMVPGILVMLVTMIGGMMCSLNIVKEKEIGTIEQINVTPIKKHHFILGKLIPFWVIGMVVFTLGLLIARFVYHIIPIGNISLLYGFLAVYLLAVLGLGLLISTYSDTQQQAMSITFFFVMIFNLMSGLYTPVESMPNWAQWIAKFNPLSYFIQVMRMVVLKGSEFNDVKPHLIAILGFAIVFNTWAILNYRKRA